MVFPVLEQEAAPVLREEAHNDWFARSLARQDVGNLN
jgi:hypothetical protein